MEKISQMNSIMRQRATDPQGLNKGDPKKSSVMRQSKVKTSEKEMIFIKIQKRAITLKIQTLINWIFLLII